MTRMERRSSGSTTGVAGDGVDLGLSSGWVPKRLFRMFVDVGDSLSYCHCNVCVLVLCGTFHKNSYDQLCS